MQNNFYWLLYLIDSTILINKNKLVIEKDLNEKLDLDIYIINLFFWIDYKFSPIMLIS